VTHRRRVEGALVTLEFATGTFALVGGILLIARPDGSLLRADRAALSGSPFGDWRVPGVLLFVLVGFGFLLAAECQRRRLRGARALSIVAGTGLVAFEIAELAWIGFQPLELAFAAVGVAVVVLAVRCPSAPLGRATTTRRQHSANVDEALAPGGTRSLE